jgi:hydroxyethylthiazole kinase-like uncharacterized protein yjeF
MTPELIAKLAKSEHQHKYDHGHALILSGGMGKGGAARLAARGALRVGAGLVTIGCPPSALLEHATQLTAIMCRPIPHAGGLTEALQDARLNALCIGPGLGLSDAGRDLVTASLKSRRAMTLDADAITLIGEDHAALNPNCVLTPHEGEFARLFPAAAKTLRQEPMSIRLRAEIAADAAEQLGCTLLLKGAHTVVAAPGQAAVFPTQELPAPWLATAGSGDVLAGVITGLLARGFAPFDAARVGAWLHVLAARQVGPGLIAEDLPEALPGVFRHIFANA